MNILNAMTLVANNAHYHINSSEFLSKIPSSIQAALIEKDIKKLGVPSGKFANETDIVRINSNL